MSEEKSKHGGKREGAGRKKKADTIEAEIAKDNAAEVKRLALEHSPQATLTLVEIMGSPEAPPSNRITAANSILDRALGKPKQQAEVEHKGSVHLVSILDKIRQKGIDLNEID